MFDDDGVFKRPPRRPPAAVRPRPVPAPSGSLRKMVDAARPTGRLPALEPGRGARDRFAERWRKIRDATPGRQPTKAPPLFEPSRYTGEDDREDDE